jgi:hypothetical protein
MDAVLETYGADDFAPWPVAGLGTDRFLALSGRLSAMEVGTAMAILVGYNQDASDDPVTEPGAGIRRLRHLAETESVIAPGGLRVHDSTTGAMVWPGCCFGLENWRDWGGLTQGEQIWLGHDPAPHTERVGSLIRLWPGTRGAATHPVDIPVAELPDLLRTVQDKLTGFLALAGQWLSQHAPSLATPLTAKLNADLSIGAPRRLPTGRGR